MKTSKGFVLCTLFLVLIAVAMCGTITSMATEVQSMWWYWPYTISMTAILAVMTIGIVIWFPGWRKVLALLPAGILLVLVVVVITTP